MIIQVERCNILVLIQIISKYRLTNLILGSTRAIPITSWMKFPDCVGEEKEKGK